MKKTLIGITGGIGSGKSIVSNILQIKGIPVYNADDESKRIIITDESLKSELIQILGKEIYFADGSLNRKLMAEKIFHDKDLITQVNHIIHPAVGKDFCRWAETQNSTIIATECALLFESGLNKRVDYSIMVYAPLPIRIQRAMQRDNATQEQIEARIKNQMDDEKKRDLADFVIMNDNRTAILPQINQLLSDLTSVDTLK